MGNQNFKSIDLLIKSLIFYVFLMVPISANTLHHESDSTLLDSQHHDKWFAIDKVQHFSYSCLVALGAQYILVNKIKMNESNALPLSLGFSFLAGVTKEIRDKKGINGFFSKRDLIANGLGLCMAGLIILIPN